MKKQFNLEYYLEHPDTKIVTRDGRDARIICTDARTKYHHAIVCLVQDGEGEELAFKFDKDGKFIEDFEYGLDLFFDIPDHKKKKVPLTYEDMLDRVKQGKTMWISSHPDSYTKCIIGFNKCHFNMTYSINSPSVKKFQYQELMEDSFIDGDPCWKEVEE